MSQFLLALLSSVANVVLPVVFEWLKKLIPIPPPKGELHTAEEKEAYRAQLRQWVNEALVEMGQALVAKGVVPGWLVPELPLIEQLIAQALNSALDAAGL